MKHCALYKDKRYKTLQRCDLSLLSGIQSTPQRSLPFPSIY